MTSKSNKNGINNTNKELTKKKKKKQRLKIFGTYIEKIEEKSNQKSSFYFNKKLSSLKESLGLSDRRKYQIDSLLKKVKAMLYRVISNAISKCLIDSYKLGRIPQNFITNVKIAHNKYYLNKTILDIYKEYNIIPSINMIIDNNLVKDDYKEDLFELLNLTLKDTFIFYITSKHYFQDLDKIAEKEQKKVPLIVFICDHFIEYFSHSKGNQKNFKRLKLSKNFIHKNVDDDDSIHSNNQRLLNNNNNISNADFNNKI